ncbi:MAG: hypothetical protein Q7T34_00460 [Candidatus Parcubacteria bacterium]|nr:hypothetical protein [Candidatus Parcubacteria bacterium]
MNIWYSLEFKAKWDRSSYRNTVDFQLILPNTFFIDLIISDLLIHPEIENFGSKIEAWRIHRRADNTEGQILTFHFYTSEDIGKDIFQGIKANLFFNFIKDNYLISDIKLRGGIPCKIHEAASDSHWSDEIKKVWPHFMTGASNTFIKLIREVKVSKNIDINMISSKEEIDEAYKIIEKEVTHIWAGYGQHSFLHHLEGVFGYEPTLYRRNPNQWFRAGREIFPDIY